MSIKTVTHLNFRGSARQALQFYQSVFGGHLVAVTYRDAHAVQDPTEADQVMWGQVAAENGFSVMAYDVPSRLPWSPGENGVFVSIRGEDGGRDQGLLGEAGRGRDDRAAARSGWLVSAVRHAQGSVRRHLGARCRKRAERGMSQGLDHPDSA